MSTATSWGYVLSDLNELPDLISVPEFNAFTGSRFAGDARIGANIPAVSESIRNYCGWHISPNAVCEMVYRVYDLRDSFTGSDLLIQLPAKMVTSVSSILMNAVKDGDEWSGDEVTDYDLDSTGLLRIYDAGHPDRRSRLRVVFEAGYSDSQIAALKELAANRISHAMSSSYGITSEAAGGVSVTYNATWTADTSSTALADNDKEILEGYRVKGVF